MDSTNETEGKKKKSTLNYDELVTQLGEFGKYQKIVCLLVCCFAIPNSFNNIGIVFIAASMESWCATPEYDHLNLTQELLRNLSSPMTEVNGVMTYDTCSKYQVNTTSWMTDDDVYEHIRLRDVTGQKTVDCQENGGWSYDTSQYKSSVVSDWDLVCDRRWLKATASSLYMAGVMIGILLIGVISDILGRKKALIGCTLIVVAISNSIPWSPNYITFVTLRFLLGVGEKAMFDTAFVIVVELVGPNKRVITSCIIMWFWVIGYVTIPGVAYLLREWRHLQMALSAPTVLLLPLLYFIPESPRWFYARGRKEEADAIMKKMAKVNNINISDNTDIVVPKAIRVYPWDLLRTPRMRLRTLNIIFNWFVNSLVYFGLSINTSNLGGNHYINFLIAGALEFPAYLGGMLSMKYMGRRWALSLALILGGLSLLGTLLVPADLNVIAIALAMCGKFFISMSFGNVYLFSAELFPTVTRNIGVSSASFFAKVAGVVAPYIAQLSDFGVWIPLVIFGAFALVAGVLTLFLPETRGKKLPTTLRDGEEFGHSGCVPPNFWNFGKDGNADDDEKKKHHNLATRV